MEVRGDGGNQPRQTTVCATRSTEALIREKREVSGTNALEVDDERTTKRFAVLGNEVLDASMAKRGSAGRDEPNVMSAEVIIAHRENRITKLAINIGFVDGFDGLGGNLGHWSLVVILFGLVRVIGVLGLLRSLGDGVLARNGVKARSIVERHFLVGGLLGLLRNVARTKTWNLVLEATKIDVQSGATLVATAMVLEVVIVEIIPGTDAFARRLGIIVLVNTEPLGHGLLLLATFLPEESAQALLSSGLFLMAFDRSGQHLNVISNRTRCRLIRGDELRGVGIVIETYRRGSDIGGSRRGIGGGSEGVVLFRKGVRKVEKRSTASDIASSGVRLRDIRAVPPFRILDRGRTRALRTRRLGGILVALLGHIGNAGLIVLDGRPLGDALAIFELIQGRGVKGNLGGINARSVVEHGHGPGGIRVSLLGDDLHWCRCARINRSIIVNLGMGDVGGLNIALDDVGGLIRGREGKIGRGGGVRDAVETFLDVGLVNGNETNLGLDIGDVRNPQGGCQAHEGWSRRDGHR